MPNLSAMVSYWYTLPPRLTTYLFPSEVSHLWQVRGKWLSRDAIFLLFLLLLTPFFFSLLSFLLSSLFFSSLLFLLSSSLFCSSLIVKRCCYASQRCSHSGRCSVPLLSCGPWSGKGDCLLLTLLSLDCLQNNSICLFLLLPFSLSIDPSIYLSNCLSVY